MSLVLRSELIVGQGFDTPVGAVHLAGVIKDSPGQQAARTLGRYALVHITAGSGYYSDASGYRRAVTAGDMLVLFPDVPHRYGPVRGGQWDEFYIVFSGPAFDLWRQRGVISPARPVVPVQPLGVWYERWRALVDGCESLGPSAKTARVCRLLELLALAAGSDASSGLANAEPRWLTAAKARLAADLSADVDLAEVSDAVGLSYENFRKRFAAETGTSPGLYRSRIKIATACELLTTTAMPLKQIAEALGFGDEFHFSHRFKQVRGVSPSRYRAGARAE
jgi:AraC-like DNA-binding protein